MQIDARGLGCPKPVMMAEEALSKMDEGVVEILVDNEASVKNLTRFATKNSLYVETEKLDNYWRIKLVKGYYSCERGLETFKCHPEFSSGSNEMLKQACPEEILNQVQNDTFRVQHDISGILSPESEEKTKKDILLIIGTDTLGKEEELGRILMKGFIETIKVTKELPHTIFFLNAGVKLTTVDDEIVNILREIENLGVEIYSCGTCLKYYNLEAELKVGHRGTTNHIVEGIKDFKKVVWI